MSQKPIDLLPESIRASCLAGIRTGRTIAVVGVAIAIVVIAATHTRFKLDRARDGLQVAEAHADQVLAAEAQARELNAQLADVRELIGTHDAIILPIELSAVLATLVNQLPPSVGLDRLDLDAQSRTRGRGAGTARNRSAAPNSNASTDTPPPRILVGEMTGFAASDDDIAELVSRMETMQPFSAVSLDFSRTRAVRGHAAREFRISFKIDLDARYVVASQRMAGAQEAGNE